MKIIKAIVIHGYGADAVLLQTDLPSGTYPFDESNNLVMKFDVAADEGVSYVETHFPNIAISEVKRI